MTFNLDFSCGNNNYPLKLQENLMDEPGVFINQKSYKLSSSENSPVIQTLIRSLNGMSFDTVETFQATLSDFNTEEKISTCCQKFLSSEKLDEDKEQSLFLFFQKQFEKKGFSGSVLIIKQGKILLHKGYGLANDQGEEITEQTIFPIGALSKQFTAVALLLLEQQGSLSIGDPIKKHLPTHLYSQLWDTVTIHQLLNHSSGIADFDEATFMLKKESQTVEQLINLFFEKPLLFKPGTAWHYSNCGYVLLGAIIENVASQSYREFIQNEIFFPSDMKNSGYGNSSQLENLATGYRENNSKTVEAVTNQKNNLLNAYAGGGIYSTTEDLLKWNKMLFSDALLSADSRKKLFHGSAIPLHLPQKKSIPLEECCLPFSELHSKTPLIYYGYGVFLSDPTKLGYFFYHFGSLEGFSSFLKTSLSTKNVIIILSNKENTPLKEFIEYIQNALKE